jgi:hypothetical protein
MGVGSANAMYDSTADGARYALPAVARTLVWSGHPQEHGPARARPSGRWG